jgi:putative ABC transport system permease protein
VSGPFTGTKPFPAADLPAGVEPMTFLFQTARLAKGGEPVTVAVVGLQPGSPSLPPVVDGDEPSEERDLLVDERAPFDVGDEITVGGEPFTVSGTVSGLSFNGGVPAVVAPIASVQKALLSGAPLATTGIMRGDDVTLPGGYSAVSAEEARDDGLRVLASAKDSISFVTGLLWAVAALIIGSVVFLSAIERTRDFAVFKATGTSTAAMGTGLAVQAVVLALASGVVGILLGLALAPLFPMPVAVSGTAIVLLLGVSLAVGLLASIFGLRKAVSVEPALAFGG